MTDYPYPPPPSPRYRPGADSDRFGRGCFVFYKMQEAKDTMDDMNLAMKHHVSGMSDEPSAVSAQYYRPKYYRPTT